MVLGIATGIVVFVYLIVNFLKNHYLKSDRQKDMIPIIGPVLGVVLSILVYLFDNGGSIGIFVGDNLLEAILVGLGSGLVATGGNQLFKKINKLASGNYNGIDEDLDKVIDEAENLKDSKDNDEKESDNKDKDGSFWI